MESVILLFFMAILSLIFLGMLYGEHLSMLGLFEGEWFRPIGMIFGKLWNGLCLAVDETIEFVLSHLSWVVAAVAGVAGLVLVGFVLGGGLASDASAWHDDRLSSLQAGGVIDHVAAVRVRTSDAPVIVGKAERDDSQLIDQAKTADYVVFPRPEYAPIRPRPRSPLEGGIVDWPPRPSITERPVLDVTFRRLGTSIVRSEFIPHAVTRGRLVDALPDPRFVDRAVSLLRQDEWRESFGLPGGAGRPEADLPESPAAAVRNLESRVHVTPGLLVAEHDLRVEKLVPQNSTTSELTVEIVLTNLGEKTIDGLLVREYLPVNTRVRDAAPPGVFRDDTLTWLIDDLRPTDEVMLRFVVVPEQGSDFRTETVFESLTEVSALTAVTTRTDVTEARPPVDPFPQDRIAVPPERPAATPRREPPLVRSKPLRGPAPASDPKLELTIDEPQSPGRVGDWLQVFFTLSNSGTADASDVKLRLTLDDSLEHSDLIGRPPADRQVFVTIPRVAVGDFRRLRLLVRPKSSGETVSTAEILHADARLDLQTFRIVARESAQPAVPPENPIR